MKVQGRVDGFISNIYEIIRKDKLEQYGPGLLTGKSGIILFLFYYSRYSGKAEAARYGTVLIEGIFKSVADGFNFPTYCDGLTGYSWLINHLVNEQFINKEDVPFLEDLDGILMKEMLELSRNGAIDFLHGSLGIAYYLLDRLSNKQVSEKMVEFLEQLEKLSTRIDENKIAWESVIVEGDEQKGYNLGLAHGHSGIILFLSKYCQMFRDERSTNMLTDACNYLQSTQLSFTEFGATFPNVVYKSGGHMIGRRMAWCYGDLGRALALLNAGHTLKNQEVISKAVAVAQSCTSLRDLKELNINEVGLCHGTAGICLIFNRLFNKTGIGNYNDAANFWYNETITAKKFELSIKNFAEYYPHEKGLSNYLSLLSGLPGIGLMMISKDAIGLSNWEKSLMI